jgi:hypothetical protein
LIQVGTEVILWDFLNFIGIIFVIYSIISLYQMNLKRSSYSGLIGFSLITGFITQNIIFNINNIEPFVWGGIWSYYNVNLLSIILIPLLFSFIIYVLLILRNSKIEEVIRVKKTILTLGTKVTRLKLVDVSDYCKIDINTVLNTIKLMIKNREILAEFFYTSRVIAFNQIGNAQEIDDLIEEFNKWGREKMEEL